MRDTSNVTPSGAWLPHTEEELQQAAKHGTLIENHTLDLKRELKGGESGNKEIAKDIAAFSIDGGLVIIGVDEATNPPSLHPVPLDGLRERVEQVGLTRVDRPVTVTTTAIPSTASPAEGYVLVEIPVSPHPPHMADNKYYARGDSTNHPLSDAEVLRWHERTLTEQQDIVRDVRDTLEEIRGGTPNPPVNLLFMARPLGSRGDLLAELFASTSWKQDIGQILLGASSGGHQEFVQSLKNPTQLTPTADGLAAVVDHTIAGQDAPGVKRAQIVFEESGKLMLTSGGLIRALPGSASPVRYGIRETVLLGHADLIVRAAAAVSGYGFNGIWQFAVAANTLGKAQSYTLGSSGKLWDDETPRYTRATYERATTASLRDIADSPQAVVRALARPLLQSLGSLNQFPWLLN